MPVGNMLEYTGAKLTPLYPGDELVLAAPVHGATTIRKGEAIARAFSDISAIQTLTISGTISYKLRFGNKETAQLTQSSDAAAIQAALRALATIGSTGMTVTGSGPFSLAWGGNLASQPMPLLEVMTVTGSGSATVAHSTRGQRKGALIPYGVIAAPSAPSVSSTGTGTWANATYFFAASYVTPEGESTLSAFTSGVALNTSLARVAAISNIPAGVTAVRVYVATAMGPTLLVGEIAVAAGATAQTDFAAPPAAGAARPPTRNTSRRCRGVAQYAVTSDDAGGVVLGNTSTSERGEKLPTASYFARGVFKLSDLAGFTADALADLGGVLVNGEITDTATAIVRF